MDTSNWITLATTIAGIIFMAGLYVATLQSVKKDIARLEAKVDKHNNFDSRIVRCEESTKSAHHRIDEIVGT